MTPNNCLSDTVVMRGLTTYVLWKHNENNPKLFQLPFLPGAVNRAQGYKKFSSSTQLSMKFFPTHKC